ncbi:MAG TPA: hypothetical protein VH985_07515 [Candidatus Binatia bacterium]
MNLKPKIENKLRCATTLVTLCVLTACVLAACQPTPVAVPPSAEPQSGVQETDTGKQRESNATSAAKPSPQTIARLLPESRIGAPEKDLASRQVHYDTTISTRSSQALRKGAWQYRVTRRGEIVGFEFSNHGGNSILAPRHEAVKNQFFTRDFQFRFDERARQDIYLMVSDWMPSRDRVFRLSEIMNRVMLFFPRAILPAIVNNGSQNLVTLPTGEEIAFDADTHEIRGGVLSEAPVDLNPDRQARHFPGIDYRGNGVMVRAEARGTDPRIGTTATILARAPGDNCDGATNCRQCQVPARELWDQAGAARFKFATDDEFDRYLQARCGFALPKMTPQFTIAAPVK